MSTHSSESFMATVACSWPTVTFLLMLVLASTSTASSAGPSGDGTIHNLRLLSSPVVASSPAVVPLVPAITGEDSAKSRKARDVSGLDHGVEDDLTSSSAAAALGQDYSQNRPVSKVKTLYPPLSGSGELFRLFRPLALTSDKTLGMTRWYLPGFGYFNRGGRAASSNFIRFGRSGGIRYFDDEDALNGGGDVSMLNRNNPKKKNNFIRLGRENPRQNNFIRLGRSGPPSQGEYYNSGYITPALSDPFREEEDGRHEMN